MKIALLFLLFLPLLSVGSARGSAAAGDMKTLGDRLIASSLPRDAKGAAKLGADAESAAKSLRTDGTWADVDYASKQRSDWPTCRHLERVLLMARAYHLARSAGKPEPSLRSKIDLSLNWWLDHDPKNPNWWHNEIGTPELIGEIALMLEPELGAPQRARIVEILQRSRWTKWTGQNLIWGVTIQIMRGLITRDVDVITQAYDRLEKEVRITTAEGIQPDFSFHQHGAQLYNGGYGLDFAIDVARFASFSWGTRWQLPPDKMKILTSYLLDGERWMMRRGRFDYSAIGREIVRKGRPVISSSAGGGAGSQLLAAIELLAADPVPRDGALRDWIGSLRGDSSARALSGNRCFWCSDYMVHQRPGWMASVKMFSTRMLNSELINDEGKQSQHLSDGANFIYLDGDEYLDVFPVWDWCKIPGTTAEQGNPDAKSEPGHGIHIKGRSAFAGGVSDGEYGLAAMELKRGGLSAHKFWFFFDDGYVCLGAGIACDSDQDVATSVNQCLLRGKVERGNNWIYHDHVGYIFNQAKDVHLDTGPRTGSWRSISPESDALVTKDVFSLWLDHGKRPKGAAYAYTVLPTATSQETAQYALHPRIQVITNTSQQQAAFDPPSGLLAAAFYQSGELTAGGWKISVDRPCLILLRRRDGRTILAVSDPSHAADSITISVNGHANKIQLPAGDHAGSTAIVTIAAGSNED